MRKLPVPPNATIVIMSVFLIRCELHPNGSDSPQVQNPFSTGNNKVGSVLSPPPKPTFNLVPKYIPEVYLKMMLPSAASQRTNVRPVRHIVVNL